MCVTFFWQGIVPLQMWVEEITWLKGVDTRTHCTLVLLIPDHLEQLTNKSRLFHLPNDSLPFKQKRQSLLYCIWPVICSPYGWYCLTFTKQNNITLRCLKENMQTEMLSRSHTASWLITGGVCPSVSRGLLKQTELLKWIIRRVCVQSRVVFRAFVTAVERFIRK